MMNKTISILRAPALQALCHRGANVKRAARVLLMTLLLTMTAQTAWATTTSTITVGSTDYTLFTGFTATDGNGTNYAKLVDGNTSTDWVATKNYDDPNAPANDFAGGTDDPAFVEFHADEPFIPKGYVLTCDHENAGFWKPVQWALKAKLDEGDGWTTIHSSTTTLGQGKTFEIACTNNGNNQYQYFRLEVYEVGTTDVVDLDELQFYGSLPAYTHLTVKAATCMATGIKVDCYRRNSDGKYFTDNTGETEIPESDVIAPIIPHTGEHHEATDVNIEYWQCSMCGKYFSDSGYTTEITEEQTKIYRTITIDGSISGLVTLAFSETQALAGTTMYLYVSDLIDASTLKVNDGAVELTAKTDIQYTFTMPAADVTVTADVAQSNADGDVLTGSIRHTVTIPDGASITLNNATITGSIVCEGSATITLVGTNSVSGAMYKAGIQIGGSGTTLTIKGDGSLTANGGYNSAGIGLSRAWNVTEDVVGGNIVINGGNITANGGGGGAGIGAGVTKDPNNSSSRKAIVGTITIAGGSVTAVGGSNADGIGAGENDYNATIQIGTVTIYDAIDKVDASSIKDFGSVVYMHGETNVTASKTDYFAIGEDGNRRLIVQKPVIADIPDQTYTGSAITPEPLVLTGSLSLTKGTDYTYSYTDNTNVGTATVTVTFKGDYASLGSVEKEFTIAPKPVTVTANNQTKEYGADDPTLTYTCDGLVGGDELTGTLSREAGEDVGDYAINLGTLANSNYTLTLDVNGAKLSITPKPITVSGITADEKTYDGTTNVTLNYANVNFNGRCGEDILTVTAIGTFADANAGEGKEVAISDIALGGTSAANYVLADQGQQTSATASITKATPEAGDFVFSAPAELSYDGLAKAATFTLVNTKTGVGSITISYYKDGVKVDAPVAAGTYTVKIDVAEGDNFAAATALTDNSWTFTITGPAEGASITIALTEEYGTYCSAYDLDFSGATGLTAYIAAGYNKTEHTLLMVKVTSVPSGTGLLLKGTAGNTYTAKVQTSPYVYSNLLTGTIAETDVTTNDLILGKSEIDNAIGFYRVSKSGKLEAGKAYLKDMVPTAGARMLSLEFYDDATGIADVRSKMSDAVTEDWYSLDGRKLQGRPTKKGLYLLNGKKVVIR